MSLLPGLLILPMPFVLLLVLGVVVGLRRPAGRRLAVTAAAALLILSLPATGKLVLMGMLGGVSPLKQIIGGKFDAVVVPLAGVFVDSNGRWWPTRRTMLRSSHGLSLARELGVPLVLSGGIVHRGERSEASVAYEFLSRAGDSQAVNIIVDESARNSAGTAFAVGKMSADWLFQRIILVSDESHLLRMSAAIRRQGLAVCAVATSSAVNVSLDWTNFVPSARGYSYAQRVVREMAAISWYALNGWLRLSDLHGPAPGEELCDTG
jgi:uncharacterized SAM-binding protein YcdF (DUF218 family)